ncbi:MAG TPA: hypothetical protein VFV52_11045 [Bacilli bacterium]|nr:hypothetical protein [Bacilli bacterium]
MEQQGVRTLNESQQKVLANPSVLTTFLYLLDGASSNEELARRTGFKPLETSVYLDRMIEAGLVGHSRLVPVGGKATQKIYEVLEPNVDFTSIVPSLSASTALELCYNKIRTDIAALEAAKQLNEKAGIKYAQIRIRPDAYGKFQELMRTVEEFIKDNDATDGEESMTFLVVGYKGEGLGQH